MRFALKICLCTVLIVAVLFAVAGQMLLEQSYESNLSFLVDKAQGEFMALGTALQAEAYGLELYYQTLTPLMLQELLERCYREGNFSGGFALYDERLNFVAANLPGISVFPQRLRAEDVSTSPGFVYALRGDSKESFLETAGVLYMEGQRYYLATRISAYELRLLLEEQMESFVSLHSLTVALSIAAMTVLSYLSTRSVRSLNRATRRIAAGQYRQRAKVDSLDEIGDLALSFNTMASAIEQKVGDLEGYAKQQRDFVANFSHELKTPMTSIIGYADMLRSRELAPEDAFMAANFIYSEGRRLEAMSLKLMDLVVLDKNEFPLSLGYARKVLGHVLATVTPMLEKHQLVLESSIEQQRILYEKDLLLTLITNLVDNARKASSPGGRILLNGRKQNGRYRISVRDFGIGIPEEDLQRITEAFFMVDKSRARAQHGAGLGLAIGYKIAQLHGSQLHFESKLNEGTMVWFDLPLYEGKQAAEEAEE